MMPHKEFKGGWRVTTLKEVTALRLSSVDKKSKDNELPVRLCNYMDVYKNNFLYGDMDFMTATATEREIGSCSLVCGDVVITKDSEKYDDIGVPAFVREDVPNLVCGYHLAILRPSSEIDGAYLFYALSTDQAQEQFHSCANGVTRFGLRKADIESIEILLPPLPEQRAIAHILGTLDDKIELNRRMNEALEAMARALFKSWFVDFDPVRAKMEGRDTGLPKHLADLFPVRLMDSELGEIPAGWRIFCLDELTDHHTKAIAPSEFPEVDFEHFSIPAYDSGQTPAIHQGNTIKSNKVIVPSDAILLSKLNPEISRVWMPDKSNERLQISSTEFLAFTPRHPANRSLLFSLFKDTEFRTMLQSMVTGTSKSHQRVAPKALKQSNVLSGTPALFDSFGDLASPMLAGIVRNRAKSQALAALRNALLPKLVFGEMRLRKMGATTP